MYDTRVESDKITQLKSDEDISKLLTKSGRRVIPRLVRGMNIYKRSGPTLEITELLFNAFKMRTCPDCGEPEKFLIFKFVAVCMKCNQFYFITR